MKERLLGNTPGARESGHPAKTIADLAPGLRAWLRRRPPARRIRLHLALLVLGTALPLAALIVYNACEHARLEEEQAHAQAMLAARTIASETERTVERTRAMLSQMARRPLVRSLHPDHCDPVFEAFGSLFPEYTNLLTVTRDGDRICSAIKPSANAPIKVDPQLYLSQTLRSQSFTIGRLTRGIFSGRWIFFVANPLADDSGEVVGIVALAIDLARLPLAPGLSELPPKAKAHLYAADGTLLATHGPGHGAVGQKIGSALSQLLPPNRITTGRLVDADGVERIFGTAAIRGTDWSTAVGIPVDVVLAPVKRRVLVSTTVFLVGLALAAVLAYFIARRIAGPLETIAAAARRATSTSIGSHDELASVATSTAPTELRTLADDFRTMLVARSAAEAALRDSEEQLSTTLLSIGDAVIATDPGGIITRMNTTAERLTGWACAQARGRPLTEVFRIIDARTGDLRTDPVRLVLEQDAMVALNNDTVLLASDGAQYRIADSAAPIRSASGDIAGVVLVFSDVTRQYQVQRALRDNEARLRMITDMLPAPVSHVGRDGRYRFANAAHERWFGHRGQDVIGRTQEEVVGADFYAHVAPHIQCARSGEKVVYETAMPSATEGTLHALVTLLPDDDRRDGVSGHFMVAFDITERKRAEEALRQSEERLRLVLRASNDAPWDWNLETGERFYSDRWWSMLGHGHEKASSDSESARAAVHPDDVSHLDRVIGTALRDGSEGFEVEYRLRHKKGHDVPVLSRGFILRDSGGKPLRVSGVSTDLSERRRAEAERHALEDQLRESQKMESMGTLAGGIAHDFNNILGAILGNVAMARQDLDEDHPVQAALKQVHRASLRARDLVEQILAFSRKRPQTLVVQPLRPVVEETLELLRSTLPARVELENALAQEALHVNADATQVQQVLMNLCTNAWHALQGHPGRIGVGLQPVVLDASAARRIGGLPSGRYAHLWVSDTGSGMDEATRSRIFEPFFTTKPVGQGTGLGLAVVHGIVASHGGSITVDSAIGHGSTFHLYFPLSDRPSTVGADGAAREIVRGHGEHVLYVDDDEVMVTMVEQLLHRAGFEVTCCRSAKEAVATVTDSPVPVDFVVTDFDMPDFSGLEVARELARTRPGLPVVIVSGYISEELRSSGEEAGVRSLLEKQNTFEELGPLLQRILASSRGATGAVADA